uniref:Protein IQ-DOMAIN 1 n=1 Tax=Opuntia streptacantha TaxID=393608 RepID=A0A7C9AMG0_OPUST
MGSRNWFKAIIRRKKVKVDKLKQPKETNANGGQSNAAVSKLSEDVAATRIQTAFRAYMARKALQRMKGAIRFQKMTQAQSVRKQATSTLSHLHIWSRVQAQIRDRRQSMVIEGRLKQKKLENQMKLEAKLHDLEVEWNGGSDTMEEILARIRQREEAAVKRERTLAYAFTHQWRASSGQNQGSDGSELGKANWGWSWKERWIAARPWERRIPCQSISPTKASQNRPSKGVKSSEPLTNQKSAPANKIGALNGKTPGKPRRLSFPGAEKPGEKVSKAKEQEVMEKKRDSIS